MSLEDKILTKQALIEALLSDSTKYAPELVNKVVDIIFDKISTALVCGDRVELRGFGSLVVRKRKKGLARNPKSGAKVEVDDRGSLYFRASRDLISSLNKSMVNDNTANDTL
jgi:integration host factor subunit beta